GKVKDDKPAPPKRPLSAFFLFKQHNYDQVKKENPNAKITELTSMIAEKWKHVTEKEKKKYEGLQQEAKAKYEKDMQAYEKKYGKPEKVKKIKKSKKGSK
uniref:High mobility group protein n=1 Tax=Tetrahymena pyriformis TaxID=5908 RepID=HMG_TETPY|nr:RecName: Full=High mobility group protein; AltName: Full=Non-histone chromosomal protein [Tetrahymena pyriformis]prf//1506384A chromosomal protein HMG [Tetrahymena pyriformis]